MEEDLEQATTNDVSQVSGYELVLCSRSFLINLINLRQLIHRKVTSAIVGGEATAGSQTRGVMGEARGAKGGKPLDDSQTLFVGFVAD